MQGKEEAEMSVHAPRMVERLAASDMHREPQESNAGEDWTSPALSSAAVSQDVLHG